MAMRKITSLGTEGCPLPHRHRLPRAQRQLAPLRDTLLLTQDATSLAARKQRLMREPCVLRRDTGHGGGAPGRGGTTGHRRRRRVHPPRCPLYPRPRSMGPRLACL